MQYLAYIIALPLIGALINGTAGFKLPRRVVEVIACASVGVSLVFALLAYSSMKAPMHIILYDWLSFSWFDAPADLYFDALSGTMAVMVTGVSFIIHCYSVGYMKGEEGAARYFMLLNLFVFSMLVLILAGSLPLMFLGWEGVGFCSYGLIGFWYKDPENATAGRKAFIVTRIGDVAFGAALFMLFYFASTTVIADINAQAPNTMPVSMATTIGILLLIGAAGKSAQLPLTVWLPDAMAGPTPVSALIHAATMVTAGVYLLIRMFPVISLSQTALDWISITGAVTAFYAATSALGQRDLKRVLAYSTISQIGYMVLGVGAGALTASLFHLFTHAFFKALLFMGAGCVILALHHEQDIFRMGGLKKSMPTVFWCFLLGALALAACPGTAGFFSKDEVLLGLYAQGTALGKALWVLAEVTSLITAIYVFRLIFLVFFGEEKTKAHPIPKIMTWSIVPLAFLSLFGGILNLPADLGGPGWLHGQLAGHGIAGKALGGPEFFVQIMTAVVFAAGLAATWYLYVINPRLRESMIQRSSRLLDFLYQAWYLDKAYYFLFVKPYGKLANILWKRVDVGVIDAAVDGTGAGLARSATFLRGAVTGKASTYITATVVGAAAIMFYFAWRVW